MEKVSIANIGYVLPTQCSLLKSKRRDTKCLTQWNIEPINYNRTVKRITSKCYTHRYGNRENVYPTNFSSSSESPGIDAI